MKTLQPERVLGDAPQRSGAVRRCGFRRDDLRDFGQLDVWIVLGESACLVVARRGQIRVEQVPEVLLGGDSARVRLSQRRTIAFQHPVGRLVERGRPRPPARAASAPRRGVLEAGAVVVIAPERLEPLGVDLAPFGAVQRWSTIGAVSRVKRWSSSSAAGCSIAFALPPVIVSASVKTNAAMPKMNPVDLVIAYPHEVYCQPSFRSPRDRQISASHIGTSFSGKPRSWQSSGTCNPRTQEFTPAGDKSIPVARVSEAHPGPSLDPPPDPDARCALIRATKLKVKSQNSSREGAKTRRNAEGKGFLLSQRRRAAEKCENRNARFQ